MPVVLPPGRHLDPRAAASDQLSTWQRVWDGVESAEEFAASYDGPYEFWIPRRGVLHAKHPDREIVIVMTRNDLVSIRSEDDPAGYQFMIEHG